jgi:rod shape-determining protein MreC
MITVFGKPLRGPSSLTRLVLLLLLSLALMMLDHRGQHLEQIRAALKVIVYPIQIVASIPVVIYQHSREAFATERTLREQNEALSAEHQAILARLQQFEALEAENARLRDMLGSAARVGDRALAAELLEVSLEPFSRRIVVTRGTRDGVYVGQPVIDAHGIMGQITEVAPHLATATLITDPSHAIPVLVSRSGLRAMVFGTGDQDSVTVPYLTASADIREGDLLVSSGMGGTFPAGYPVATVTTIENDPNEAFLAIGARPAALLNHGKQVLLVWPGQGQTKPRGPTSAKAAP